MHPNQPHQPPELRPAQLPADARRLDGRAARASSRQLTRLQEQVGRVDRAHIPEHANEPLYGYSFELHSGAPGTPGTRIDLSIDTNEHGEPIGLDREFVDARNRLAVVKSRERSRGSRRFNFGFLRSRGEGEGGHGYNLHDDDGQDGLQEQYNTQLYDFIARKVDGHAGLNSQATVTEAVSRAVIQEQQQMSTLERMAAEQKSSARAMNFFRNHKKSRIAAGLFLSGLSVLSLGLGQVEIALPAMALRGALAGTGGYELGRTGYDALQGRSARNRVHTDIRMVSTSNGDLSGRLSPEAGFQRLVKIHGAEARAGSSNAERRAFARRLGAGLVHEHYTGELNFAGGHTRTAIRDQVRSLHETHINPLQEERLRSDQQQSRRRHLAGVAGAGLMLIMPIARPLGLIDAGGAVRGVGGIFGHDSAAHAAAGHGSHSGHGAGHHGKGGSHGSHNNARHSTSTKALEAHTGGATVSTHGANSVVTVPNGPNGAAVEITINGGPGNDTISINSLGDAAHNSTHPGAGHHTAANHAGRHAHETFHGISTSELHVKAGGGFISTLQEQYNLSPAQAEAAYHHMYAHLQGAHGTYMEGSDIRISAPGDYDLPPAARADLEAHLKSLHRMSEHLHHAQHAGAHTGGGETTTGTHNPDAPAADAITGGAAAPDETAAVNAIPVPTAPATVPVTGGATPIGPLPTSGGDHLVNPALALPQTGTPQHDALTDMLNKNSGAGDTAVPAGTVSKEMIAQAQHDIGSMANGGGTYASLPSADKAAIQDYIHRSLETASKKPGSQESVKTIMKMVGGQVNDQNLQHLNAEQWAEAQRELIILGVK